MSKTFKFWTADETAYLKKHHSFKTNIEIAKTLNRTVKSVSMRVNTLKLVTPETEARRLRAQADRQRYPTDETFFSTYTPLSCYFAGFLAADGWISEERSRVCLELSEKDVTSLEAFKAATKFEGNIGGPYYNAHAFENSGGICKLAINSDRWIDDLRTKFNIGPRKSLTLMPPPLTNDRHIIAFIAGLIDGDGSVGVYGYRKKRKITGDVRVSLKPHIALVGTQPELEWVKLHTDRLIEHAQGFHGKPASVSKLGKSKVFQYHIHGSRALKLLATIKRMKLKLPLMERKWKILEEFEDVSYTELLT